MNNLLQFSNTSANLLKQTDAGNENRLSIRYNPENYKDYRCSGSIMKKTLWLLTTLLVGFSSVSTHAAFSSTVIRNAGGIKPTSKNAKADGIQFTEASWQEILKKAKAEKKVIFLDAYASWCGPCKMLQKTVFTKKEVGDFYNSKFINVKMDMEKGEGPALSQVYPLEAYPTLLFIDGTGRVLKKFIGAPKAEELIAIGKSVRQDSL